MGFSQNTGWYNLPKQIDLLKAAIQDLLVEKPVQIVIASTSNIDTTATDENGVGQKGKNVVLTTNSNIQYNTNAQDGFVATFLKTGTGVITFIQGTGREIIQVNETAILDGAVGSSASISSVGLKDYLRISNV